ncbi:MAG: cytochrome c-type biogenesis protein [Pseudomonadota bacterium]
MTTRRAILMLLAAVLLWASPPSATVVWGANPSEQLQDPELEARARALGKELRCLVCQNQSIDASDAEVARDLRLLVRERISAGDTDEEVLTYLTDRYGPFVRLRPPVTVSTSALWVAPVVIVLLGGGAAFIYLRSRGKPASEGPLSEDEEEALANLLAEREREP